MTADPWLPPGYEVRESLARVGDGEPVFRSRFRRRADRRARDLNALITFPSFRYGVVRDAYSPRWCVVPFQNYAEPVER